MDNYSHARGDAFNNTHDVPIKYREPKFVNNRVNNTDFILDILYKHLSLSPCPYVFGKGDMCTGVTNGKSCSRRPLLSLYSKDKIRVHVSFIDSFNIIDPMDYAGNLEAIVTDLSHYVFERCKLCLELLDGSVVYIDIFENRVACHNMLYDHFTTIIRNDWHNCFMDMEEEYYNSTFLYPPVEDVCICADLNRRTHNPDYRVLYKKFCMAQSTFNFEAKYFRCFVDNFILKQIPFMLHMDFSACMFDDYVIQDPDMLHFAMQLSPNGQFRSYVFKIPSLINNLFHYREEPQHYDFVFKSRFICDSQNSKTMEVADEMLDEVENILKNEYNYGATDVPNRPWGYVDNVEDEEGDAQLFNDTRRSFEQMATTSQKVEETCDRASELIDLIYKGIESYFARGGIICDVSSLAVLIYDSVVCLYNKYWVMVPSILTRILLLLKIPVLAVNSLVTKVLSYLSPQCTERGEAQAGSFDLIPVLCAGFCACAFSVIPDKNTMFRISNAVRLMAPLQKISGNMFDWFCDWFKNAPEIIKTIGSYIFPSSWMDELTIDRDVRTWFAVVHRFDNVEARSEIAWNSKVQDEIVKAYQFGELLMKEAIARKLDFFLREPIARDTFKVCKELYDMVLNARGGAGTRPVPFCVAFVGSKGIGKSSLVPIFVRAMAPAEVPDEQLIYGRRSENDFWDNYSKQYCVTFDDFAQDSSSTNTEYKSFVDIISNIPLVLNFASLEDKGGFFQSPLVVLTTNVAYPRVNSFVDNEALHRRRHVLWEVTIDSKFATSSGELDKTKTHPGDYSPWKFQRLSSTLIAGVPQYLTRKLSFEEMIRYSKAEEVAFRRGDKIARDNAFAARGLRQQLALEQIENGMEYTGYRDPNAQGISQFVADARLEGDAQVFGWFAQYSAAVPNTPFDDVITFRTDDVTLDEAQDAMALIEEFDRLRQPMPTKWEAFKEKIKIEIAKDPGPKDVLKVAGLFLGVCGAAYLAYKVVKTVKSWGQEGDANMMSSGDSRTARMARKVPVIAQEGRAHVSMDPNSDDVAEFVRGNHGFLSRPGFHLMCMAVGGKFFVTTKHMFKDVRSKDWVEDGTVFTLSFPDTTVNFPFCRKFVAEIGTKDIVVFYVPTVRSFKAVHMHFIHREDLAYHQRMPAVLYSLSVADFSRVMYSIDVEPCSEYKYSLRDSKFPEEKIGFYLQNGWKYRVNTTKGECMAVVMAQKTSLPHKILGFHVAGGPINRTSNTGYAELVLMEEIVDALQFLKKEVCNPLVHVTSYDEEEGIACVGNAKIAVEGTLNYQYTVDPKFCIRQPTTTNIRPSVIHDLVREHVEEPAVLTPKDPRLLVSVSPIEQGINKYGKEIGVADQKIVDQVVEHLKLVIAGLPSGTPRLLTDEEVVNGVVGEDYLDPLRLDTSPGYPYRLYHHGSGSKELFSKEHPYIVTDDLLLKRYTEREERARKGERITSIFVDTLKDERLPKAKIEIGKTRVFTVVPKDFVMLVRKFFLFFCASFYANCGTFFSYVGCNPESYQWTALVNRLKEVGGLGFAGDFKAFDGTMLPQFMLGFLDVVNYWYNDSKECQLVRAVLMDEMIYSTHMAMNVLYYVQQGNPSGNPITIVLNTVVNYMYHAYAWLKLAPSPVNTMYHFDLYCRCAIVGDDSIICVKPEYSHFYNLETVSAELSKLGLSLVASSKDGREYDVDCIENFTFLKRGFRREGNIWFPTMCDNTIYEMINWVRDSPDDFVATIVNCNNALRFASCHGYDYFIELYQRLRKAFVFIGRTDVPLMDYSACLSYFQQGIDTDFGLMEYTDMIFRI